ncbi:MAG: hypothetical protein Q9219_003064 [cf. Caloplaca sp. 3 TL-2023]
MCASHPALHNHSRRNDFCYYHHGNSKGLVPHWTHGPDRIEFNGHKRNIPYKNPPLPMSKEENAKYCEPICRDFRHWNLPVMLPWSPSKHGLVESRHQLFTDIKEFPFEDGVAGQWPVQEPVHPHPGGYSTTGAGTIDFWQVPIPEVDPPK